MRVLLIVLLSGALSCVFDDVKSKGDAAPIEALARPADYAASGNFGLVLDGYSGRLTDDTEISRIVVSAGDDSAHSVLSVWNGAEERPRDVIFDGCADASVCARGVGADVIGIPLWDGFRDCVLTSSARERSLTVQCESNTMMLNLVSPPPAGFGTALAALPDGNAAGVAIVGAPESGMVAESGELWKLVAGNPGPVQLTVGGDSGIGTGAELGAALAAAALPSGDALVVAAAPGASRVVAFRLPADPTALTLETLGCIDDAVIRAPGADVALGGSIAAGDVDGDSIPDLIIGDPNGNRVSIVSGSSLNGAAGCEDPSTRDDPSSATIECSSVNAPSVETCASFGAAVDVGDVNGDGIGDVIVGAPGSTVNGDAAAGAVYTIPGSASGPEASAGRGLGLSQTQSDMRLGQALTTAPSQLTGARRDEVVASAPGDARIFLFWCTGVAGDDAAEGRERCLDTP